MIDPLPRAIGRFCWQDLAAADLAAALRFYETVFGWSGTVQRANGGSFTRLQSDGQAVASLYPLNRADLERGVPSHWTPYVRVAGIDRAVGRARVSGGTVLVAPFVVEGIARIALIEDAVGAMLGLWEDLAQ